MASDYARMRMAEARLKHGFCSTHNLPPNHPRADFMLRTENSAFRPVERLTRLLIQVQQARKQQEASKAH